MKSQAHIRILAFLLLLATVIGCSTTSELVEQISTPYESLQIRLEQLRLKHKVPGMAAALAQDGEILCSNLFKSVFAEFARALLEK